MTTCQEFPEMRISTDDSHDGVLELMLAIKPNWNKEEIQIESLSGGYSSNMFRCFSKSLPEEAVTVRVRRLLEKFNAPHSNPEFEIKAIKELSRVGHFPPLLAIFGNGYCYKYIKGGPIAKSNDHEREALSVDMIKLVARELASVHLVVVPGADYTRSSYFATMAALLDNDQLAWREEWPPQKVLVQEVDVIQEYACAEPSSMVLCHGDFHSGNMVFDKEQGRVFFVDWELAYIGHRACDIAYFINAFEYVDYLRDIPHKPTPDFERLFCQHYLERVKEIQCKGDSIQQTAEEDFQRLLAELRRFKLVVIFQWLIYIVAFWETTQKLGKDTAKLVNYNINRYLNAKEEAFRFRRFGR